MDDPTSSENDGISMRPTISSVLGVQGPLRIRPHRSTQKAHLILRRVETSDDSSDESEGNGSSRFVSFSLFAQKRIEVKPGKEILVAVTDGRFKGRPILFTGDLLRSNNASGEEDKGMDTEEDFQAISFAKHALPPKMRRVLTKKTDEVRRVVSEPSVVPVSVGVQAAPELESTSVQAQPDFSSVAVQSETRTSSTSVQTQGSVSSASVQVDTLVPSPQVPPRHASVYHVDVACQTMRDRDRSLSPMELDSPTDEISKSSATSPPPPESPLFSPTVVPSLIANLNTSPTSDSEDEDMQVSPIETPPPSLLLLPSDPYTGSKDHTLKPIAKGELGTTPTPSAKDSSSSSSIPPAPAVEEPTPKPARVYKKAAIPNPFVSAGFVTEFTGEARVLQETSRISSPIASPTTVDVEAESTNKGDADLRAFKLPTPPSPSAEVLKKASLPSTMASQTENRDASSKTSAAREVVPSTTPEIKPQEEVPVKTEKVGNTPLPRPAEQPDPKPPAAQFKPSAPAPTPPSPPRATRLAPTMPHNIPTGPRNAAPSSSRSQLDRIGRPNPPPNAPRAPLSLRAMEKAPAGPPPDLRSVTHISSGPYSNSLGIRPSNIGMSMPYPSPSPSAPSAPKSLAGVSSSKKRVVIGAGWPHVKSTVETPSPSPVNNMNSTGSASQTQEAKASSADLVSYPKSPSPCRTPPPPPTQPPAISPQPPPPEPIKIKWKRVDGLSVNTNINPNLSTSSASVLERISPTNVKARKPAPTNVQPPESTSLPTRIQASEDLTTAAVAQEKQAKLDNKNSPKDSTAPNGVPSAQEKVQKDTAQVPAATPLPEPTPTSATSTSQAANGNNAKEATPLAGSTPTGATSISQTANGNNAEEVLSGPDAKYAAYPYPKITRAMSWIERYQINRSSVSEPTPVPVPTPVTSAFQGANESNAANLNPDIRSSAQNTAQQKGIHPMSPPPVIAPGLVLAADAPAPKVEKGDDAKPLSTPAKSPTLKRSRDDPDEDPMSSKAASAPTPGPVPGKGSLPMKVSKFQPVASPALSVASIPANNLPNRPPSFVPANSDKAPAPSGVGSRAPTKTATTPSVSHAHPTLPATTQPPSKTLRNTSTANSVASNSPIATRIGVSTVNGPPPSSPVVASSNLTRNASASSSGGVSTTLPSSIPANPILNASLPVRPVTNPLPPTTPSTSQMAKMNDGVMSSSSAPSDSPASNPATTSKVLPSPISTTMSSTGAKPTLSPTTPGSQLMKHPLPARPAAARGVKRERPPSPVNARDTIEPLRRRKRVFKWPTLESNHSIVLRGEGDLSIMGLTFSSDGMFLALNCADKTIRIWNNQTRMEMARLSHNARVVTVMWIEGDGGVVSLGEDGLVSKWTRTGFNHWQWAKVVDTGTEPSVPGEEGGMCLAYKRDRIAVSFPRTGVKVWIWSKGSWQAQRLIARQNVTALTFIEDGAALLGGTQDGVLWSCQVPNGTLRAIAFVKAKIACIEINPAKTHALLAHVGGAARLVSLLPDKKGHAEQTYSNKETQARPQCGFGAIFAAQGQGVLFGDVDGCALVWDTRKGSLVYGLDHGEGERGEDEVIRSAAGFESANGGGCLVTGTKAGLLSWWSQPAYTNPNSNANAGANSNSNSNPNPNPEEPNKRARVS